MIVVTLIATIIHMNNGFEFWEALGRGFVSALLAGVIVGVTWVVFILICSLLERH